LSHKTIKIAFDNTNLCGIGQFGQVKFMVLSGRTSPGQSHYCWPEKQVIDIAFSLRTQADTEDRATQRRLQQHSQYSFRASEYCKAEPQCYFNG